MRAGKAIIAVAVLLILFAFQHTVEAKSRGSGGSRSRGHGSSSSHSSSNYHTSGNHETHSQSHSSYPTQRHDIFHTPFQAISYHQPHSSYHHTAPAHDAGGTFYPQAGVAHTPAYHSPPFFNPQPLGPGFGGIGFDVNAYVESLFKHRNNHDRVVHDINKNDKGEDKIIIIDNVEPTPQAAVLGNDTQSLNPPIQDIFDGNVYQNPGSQQMLPIASNVNENIQTTKALLDTFSNTLTETNAKLSELLGLNTNLATTNNLQSGFGEIGFDVNAFVESLLNHRNNHDRVVHDSISNHINNNNKEEEKFSIINNENVESTLQVADSGNANQNLNSPIPAIVNVTHAIENTHTPKPFPNTSSNTLTETNTKAPESVGLNTDTTHTANSSPSGGVMCIPKVNNTDPQNAGNTKEVEKIACFLAPTEKLQASETLFNATTQQLAAGAPVIGNDHSQFSPSEILSSIDEMNKQMVVSSGIKSNYIPPSEPLNPVQTTKSTRSIPDPPKLSTVPHKDSSAGEPTISVGVILSLLLFFINF